MAVIFPTAPLTQVDAQAAANSYQEQFTLSGYNAVGKTCPVTVYLPLAIPTDLEAEYDAASPTQKLVFVNVCLQVMSELPPPEDFVTRFLEIYNAL